MQNIEIYSRVKSPQFRLCLIACLRDLRDKNTQLREWVKPQAAHAFSDNVYLNISCMHYDLPVYDYPEDSIGWVTVNQDEVKVIAKVYKALDEVDIKIGPNQPDTAYINNPLWERVIEVAKDAYTVFMQTEKESKKIHPRPWDGIENWIDSFPED
jgi:hypothetical protein